jgi:hypothetical protein
MGTAYITGIDVSQTGWGAVPVVLPRVGRWRRNSSMAFSWASFCSLARGYTARTTAGLDELAGILINSRASGARDPCSIFVRCCFKTCVQRFGRLKDRLSFIVSVK